MEQQNNETNLQTANGQSRRWYDKDPVLSKAMHTLENTDDQLQIQIALNLIKIVIEHRIEQEEVQSVDDIISSVKDASDGYDDDKKKRWYDLNETVRAAIYMLETSPDDMQKRIATDMAELVRKIIQSGGTKN